MASDASTTTERIIAEASDLFLKHGFHAVSMKTIACQAQVSEMTVFRHFPSKKQVLEAVMAKMSYLPSIKAIFEDQLCGDLEKDLLLLSETYQKIMDENQTVFLIGLREEKSLPPISEFLQQGPPQVKALLKDCFVQLQEKKKIITADYEALTLTFLAINFGYFFFKVRGINMVGISDKQYLETAVHTFVRGIQIYEA